jgi:hypothetical protein
MTQTRGQTNSSSNRLDALRARHTALSTDIERLMKHLSISDFDLRRLKLEKLQIKEEIEKIRQAS